MSGDKVISRNNYFPVFYNRICEAVKRREFWVDFLFIFCVGSFGLWVPPFIGWGPNSSFMGSFDVLIFGVATSSIIIGDRLFMSKDDDQKEMTSKAFIFFLCFFAIILYVKGANDTGGSYSVWSSLGLLLTVLMWFFHHVNRTEYDTQSAESALGGSL
ncbi:hypothetical protein [Marinobacter excellens]|jgi:hypothetical protein|uniref:hypothetical protein n=1 Tax=Marinobacter excellens TaxID=218670 RepID=UPI000774C3A5|nr:hypothetical protein [Marinobacter excellens]